MPKRRVKKYLSQISVNNLKSKSEDKVSKITKSPEIDTQRKSLKRKAKVPINYSILSKFNSTKNFNKQSKSLENATSKERPQVKVISSQKTKIKKSPDKPEPNQNSQNSKAAATDLQIGKLLKCDKCNSLLTSKCSDTSDSTAKRVVDIYCTTCQEKPVLPENWKTNHRLFVFNYKYETGFKSAFMLVPNIVSAQEKAAEKKVENHKPPDRYSSRLFSCPYDCNIELTSTRSLLKHIETIHKHETRACPNCYKVFQLQNLIIHFKKCVRQSQNSEKFSDKLMKCLDCSRVLFKKDFIKHLKLCTGKKVCIKTKCPDCGKNVIKKNITEHKKMCISVKKVSVYKTCHYCHQTFTHKGFNFHMRKCKILSAKVNLMSGPSGDGNFDRSLLTDEQLANYLTESALNIKLEDSFDDEDLISVNPPEVLIKCEDESESLNEDYL